MVRIFFFLILALAGSCHAQLDLSSAFYAPILKRAPAGAPAFSPSDVSGLVQWLNIDSLSGTSDGAAVGTWNDSSGVGKPATQATEENKPLYKLNMAPSGRAALVFQGNNNHRLSTAAFDTPLSQPYTTFFVLRFYDLANTAVALHGISGGNAGGVYIHSGAPSLRIYAGAEFTMVSPVTTNWYAGMVLWNGATSIYRINGGANTTANTPGTQAITGLRLGVDSDGTSNPGPCHIGEVLIYSGAVSDVDKVKIFDYLNARWLVY